MESSSSPNNSPFKDWQFWAMWTIIMMVLLTGGISKCHAKDNDRVDTILCKHECIVKIIEKTTPKSVRYIVLYRDKAIGLDELIDMSKSVKEYIEECWTYNVKPQLGIKLKNGEIQSIVRIRKKWHVSSK